MKTRLLRHRDGRQEIFRVLSADELADWKGGGSLAYERSIVWLEDIDRLPFVRVVEVRCAKSRRGKLLLNGSERVVGYTKLMADAPRDLVTSRFTRRLFYLKDGDEQLTTPPEQAIDPRTLLPGVLGQRPARKSDKRADFGRI